MADLDAKDILTKNIPLIVLYVLALVPVILWFVMVGSGVKGGGRGTDSFDQKANKLKIDGRQIDSLERDIKNPDKIVYTDAHLEQFTRVHGDYAKQIDQLRAVVRERDQALEKWFPGTKLKKDGKPKPNDYITQYRRELKELSKTYASVLGSPPKIYDTEPDPKRLAAWQKRFWIQKYLFESLKQGSKETLAAGGPSAQMEVAPRFSESVGFGKAKESNESVERISVSVAFTCRFSDLPRIISQIFGQQIAFEIVNLKLEKAPFEIKDDKINLFVEGRAKTFNEPYYTAELEGHAEFKGEGSVGTYLPEPVVKVILDLEVLDFTVKPPPPPKKEPDLDDLDDLDDDPGPKKKK